MAGGLPAPDVFPSAEMASTLARLMAERPEVVLQYSATEGYLPLREWVADRYAAHPDQVLITNGSQQAMELITRASIDPGGVVVLADPGYVGAVQAFQLNGARLCGLSTDHLGFDVAALEEALQGGLRPSIVYVVPNFHNPTSATMDLARRRSLADLADHFGFMVLEDDPYGHLRWAGEELPPVSSMSDRVVSIGTTSKLLSPGLRIGWVVAPPELAERLTIMKQAVDLHTSTLAQHVVHGLVSTPGFLDAHVTRLRPAYEERAKALAEALRRHLGDRFHFSFPDGGMFIWGGFSNPTVDTRLLLPHAVGEGVAFVPGSAFAVNRPHSSEVRLSFATASPEELDIGVSRLTRALEACPV
jgi:2-aminoadipate transaminase